MNDEWIRAQSRRLTAAHLVWILLGAGLLWRIVRYALGFPIWGDEAFVAVNFVPPRSYVDLIAPLRYGQIVPLLFMWAELAVSRWLGLSEWALRLLPFLAGIAALLLYWRFARTVLGRRPAVLALAFFAAGYYIVRHATEIKPYITDLLISLVLTMLAWSVFQRPRAPLRWVLLIVFGGAAVWCSYPAVFVAGGVGALLTWLVIREKSQRTLPLVGWALFGIVTCGSFIAMYMVYGHPHAVYAAHLTEISMWSKTFPPLDRPWLLPVWFVAIHTGLMFAYPHGGTAPGSIITFALVVIGAVRMWRTQRPLLVLLLVPIFLTFVAAAMKKYPYGGSARTSLYMAPAICLLAGLGLYVVFQFAARRWRMRQMRFVAAPSQDLSPAGSAAHLAYARRNVTSFTLPIDRLSVRVAVQITAITFATFAVIETVHDVFRPYTSKAVLNSREAVRTCARQTRPGDRWITFNAIKPVDYAPYLGDWRGVGGQFVFDACRFAPVPLTWAPPPDSVSPDPPHRVWLFSYQGYKVDFPDAQFAAYLGALTQRLGPSQYTRYTIKTRGDEIEALDVYLFEPRAGG